MSKASERCAGRPPLQPNSAKALARPGDPYVLPGGVLLKPDRFGDEVEEENEQLPASAVDVANFRSKGRRSLAGLPDKPEVLNIVAAVFLYTMLGITDREIGHILNVDSADIGAVRQKGVYKECFETISRELINVNNDNIHNRLAAHANAALGTVIDLSLNGEKEQTRLRASTDILDRAGIGPENVQGKNSQNELRIVIMKEKDAQASLELNGEVIDAVVEDI